MKLQMVNVTRKFGDFRAVENLNLTIENIRLLEMVTEQQRSSNRF